MISGERVIKFSVIIPALNEGSGITASIEALLKQTVPRSDYEIVVVDNASTDDTAEIAKSSGADRVILEPSRGTNIARARGVHESEGEIVAFLDADCVPPANWLEQIEDILSDPANKAISGPCDIGLTGFRRPFEIAYTRHLFPVLDRLLYFFFRRRAGVIMGGNFATHRSTIDLIGGLPPLTFHGDDSAIAMLISRKVGRVLFLGDFVVKSSPRRFEREGHLRLTIKYAWHYLRNYFALHKACPAEREIGLTATLGDTCRHRPTATDS